MKKLVLRKLLLPMCICTSFITSTYQVSAQTYNAPGSFEDTWPGPGPIIGLTGHTSAYSMWSVNTVYGPSNLVLAGYDDPNPAQPAVVSWRLLTPGAQGTIPYPAGTRDLEVGYLDAMGDPEILVAYHTAGVGHFIDVYSIATGAPVLLYTNPLSAIPNYTRISIDCHLTYAATVAWEDAGGITTTMILNTNPLTFSGQLLLAGTNGETTVDCAFSHTGPLEVQYVYYNPVSGNLTESSYDFWTGISQPTGTYIPNVRDINYVGSCRKVPCDQQQGYIPVCPYPNIDCRGHDGVANWAYTYTLNNMDISVRLLDLNTSLFPATVIVNNGSLGNIPNNMNTNIHPFPAYDQNCGPTGLNIAWYTNNLDPATMPMTPAGYIGVRMNESGTALFSPNDYLTIANNPTWASPSPVLSLSKQDDMFGGVMYTVFPELDPMVGAFRLENKFPTPCANSYKGNGEETQHEIECGDMAKLQEFYQSHGFSTANIGLYPNPYTNSFKLTIPADAQESEAAVIITDIKGVKIAEYNGQAAKANEYLGTLNKDIASGTYFVNVTIEGKAKQTFKVVKL